MGQLPKRGAYTAAARRSKSDRTSRLPSTLLSPHRIAEQKRRNSATPRCTPQAGRGTGLEEPKGYPHGMGRGQHGILGRAGRLILLLALGATSACSSASTSTETPDSGLAAEPSPGSTASASASEPTLPSGYYRFGETTPELPTSRFRPPVTFSVTPPQEFTPAEPAESPLAVNMFFIVTASNLSAVETWRPTILTEACSDEEVRSFIPCKRKGEIIYTDGRWTDYPDELPPGESMSFRVEYSLASSEFVTLELDVDGQAGPSIYFVSEPVRVDG